MSVTLTGLTADLFYTVAVTAVDLLGQESACSTAAGAVARPDGSTVGSSVPGAVSSSDPGAVSSSDSGAVSPSEPVAVISGDGVAVYPSDGVAVDSSDGVAVNPTGTGDSSAVEGGSDIWRPVEGTDDRDWRWR